MQQTSFPVEIIVGDDESNDGTTQICLEYVAKYPDKIRLLHHFRKDVIYINGNPTGRNNFMSNIRSATGKYIALLPGDDYWTDSYKLQTQVDILEAFPECIACHHWHQIAVKNDDRMYTEKEAPRDGHGYYPKQITDVRDIFANRVRIKSRTIMFRNLFLEGFSFPEWFRTVQFGDVALSMILGKFGDFYFLDEVMAVYRMTGTGVSTMGNKDPLFTLKHYLEWIRIWEQGDKFHGNRYHTEAIGTILYFYKSIFAAYNYSRPVFRKSMNYALYHSAYNLFQRISIARRVLRIYNENRGPAKIS